MKNLRLNLSLWTAQYGWWPWIAMAMIVPLAFTYGLLLPGIRNDHMLAQQQHHERLERLQASRAQRSATPITPAPLNQFRARLANDKTRSAFMRQMWQDAAHLNLKLTKVEFKEERNIVGNYLMLHVNASVTGDYPSIKAYTFKLMKRYPSLSLDSLEFKRESISQAQLEAPLRFTLLMEP